MSQVVKGMEDLVRAQLKHQKLLMKQIKCFYNIRLKEQKEPRNTNYKSPKFMPAYFAKIALKTWLQYKLIKASISLSTLRHEATNLLPQPPTQQNTQSCYVNDQSGNYTKHSQRSE